MHMSTEFRSIRIQVCRWPVRIIPCAPYLSSSTPPHFLWLNYLLACKAPMQQISNDESWITTPCCCLYSTCFALSSLSAPLRLHVPDRGVADKKSLASRKLKPLHVPSLLASMILTLLRPACTGSTTTSTRATREG